MKSNITKKKNKPTNRKISLRILNTNIRQLVSLAYTLGRESAKKELKARINKYH